MLKSFKELAAGARRSFGYLVQNAIMEFTRDVAAQMHSEGVTKADLARKLGTTPAYTTKMLSGSTNFTLETMVKVAFVLNSELRVHLQPKGWNTHWMDIAQEVSAAPTIMDVPQWNELFTHSQKSPLNRRKVWNEEVSVAA